MNPTRFQTGFGMQVRLTAVRNKREKHSKNFDRRVRETAAKFLKKQQTKKEKVYDTVRKEKMTVSSVQLSAGKLKPEVNRSILWRERTVEAILVKEIQEIIDSGQVGEELRKCQVQITSAAMNSKFNSLVFWKPLGSKHDEHVKELLNRCAGYIRHILMHNHVVGHVPKLRFAVNNRIIAASHVDQTFSKMGFDETNSADLETKKISKTFSTAGYSPASRIFGIDQNTLTGKIKSLKKFEEQDLPLQNFPKPTDPMPKGIVLRSDDDVR